MPSNKSGVGRLVPASPLEFSRYAKNLAWLLEAPLHVAHDLLAACYGFGSVHELKKTIPAPGEDNKPTGPFDAPRERPPYFPVETDANPNSENRLTPLSPRERQLLLFSERIMYKRTEQEGRFRRRHYAVLDAAFFSAPSVHRKKFAELKLGILAMEGSDLERERYLELNWPPAFWSYLEATQLLHINATQGLSELKDSSVYFDQAEVMSIADLFHATAAHRAPAIFLAMVGESPEPLDEFLPGYSDCFDCPQDLPSIRNGREGLFEPFGDDYFWEVLHESMPGDSFSELPPELFEMEIREIATSPPKGTPEQVIAFARKWRLHQLRGLSGWYVGDEDTERCLAKTCEMFWPGSAGNTVTEKSDLVWEISRNAPSLYLYSEFCEVDRSDNTDSNCKMWKFKAILTRFAPDDEEDVVGYMAGWLVDPCLGHYVCEETDLYAHDDQMLSDGVDAFLKAYIPFNGHDDLVAFVNSQWNTSVAITEIVLRDKYKKIGLTPLAFTAFTAMFQNAPYTDFPDGWLEWADFDLDTDADISDREPDVDINPPGVFMVPVQRKNKRLRSYLVSLTPYDELDQKENHDVFPFHFEAPK